MRHRIKTSMSALMAALMFVSNAYAQPQESTKPLYFGADLSYVNEVEDCGAKFRYKSLNDPYEIFAATGHNLVRVRLWNDPEWTQYSNPKDVTRTIKRAKAAGMQVLLDFHYADDWADGDHQPAPKSWQGLSTEQQVKSLYDFTTKTLMDLHALGLMPEMVQVGNETNYEMASGRDANKRPINWMRNAALFNAGIKAVRDAGKATGTNPKIMLHIAQPENIMPWFKAAQTAGITDFDTIGISYYKKWSKYSMTQLGDVIKSAHRDFAKEIIVVETAYPYTSDHADQAANLMGDDSAFAPYGTSPKGQARYVQDLMQLTIDNGGAGVVYWEPAWLSTPCKTRWGQGSHWENATFFDFKGKALPALSWPLSFKR